MKKYARQGFALLLLLALSFASIAAQVVAAPAANGTVKQLGSIRKISGSDLTLVNDQGSEVAVKVAPGARLLRLAPGETDLKSAAQIRLSDLQVGDRVLVRGKLAGDGVAIDAAAVVVMKQQDIAQLKQQELLDWQKRSVGGVVKQVDSADKSITLSIPGAGESKSVTVVTSEKTSFNRYSPNSVKWEDAISATLGDIRAGDQLRAKGNRSDDGTQIAAEKIVAGTFLNIAGLITGIDAAQGSLTVQDLATKKPVVVKVTADSQMKKLPPQMAQGLAMRMKGANVRPGAQAGTQGATPAGGERPRGGDVNQLLGRLPAASLADLQKGEAVMIVSTQGSAGQSPVAITLLGGVEAILTASPTGTGAQSFLTPWSLAGAPGGDQ
jgi:co-chaperonin GroES (HSP10)